MNRPTSSVSCGRGDLPLQAAPTNAPVVYPTSSDAYTSPIPHPSAMSSIV